MLKSLIAELIHRLWRSSRPRAPAPDQSVASLEAERWLREGDSLLATSQFESALRVFAKAVALAPPNAHAYIGHAKALLGLQRFGDARTHLRCLLGVSPGSADALCLLAEIDLHEGDLDSAKAHLSAALSISRQTEYNYIHLGRLLAERCQFHEAQQLLDDATRLMPGNALIYFGRGNVLLAWANYFSSNEILAQQGLASGQQTDLAQQAVGAYEKAASLGADFPALHEGLANAYLQANKLDLALDRFNKIAATDPASESVANDEGAQRSIASSLKFLGRNREAIACYERILAVSPHDAQVRLGLSHAQLAIGEWCHGWKNFEARLQLSPMDIAHSRGGARWRNTDDLNGKILVLRAEQGRGDAIQFCRFSESFRQRGARVILHVAPPLADLLSRTQGVESVCTDIRDLDHFDFQLPLMSSPGELGISLETLPRHERYISPDDNAVTAVSQLLPRDGFRVGICWRGSPYYQLEKLRSPGLNAFRELMKAQGASFVTLLPESREEFISAGGYDLGHEVDQGSPPFQETAAIIASLDLVITSDTSVAHLAGALGTPTWTVLPKVAEWRWLERRSDSPWYPKMRLFRQTQNGNWSEVFNRVERCLIEAIRLWESRST